ncbi:MAG: serine protease [Pseudomonadota bacterium]
MEKAIKMFRLGILLGLTGCLLSGCLTLSGFLRKEVEELRYQVQDLSFRLQTVESQPEKIKGVIKQARVAVVYLWGTYTFTDSEGRPLRYVLTTEGKPIADPKGTPKVDITGTGPVAISNYCGTAFLVDREGGLLTNRHVAEPWWEDEKAAPLLKAGLQPVFLRLRAFFQERPEGVPIKVVRIHPEQDLAFLKTISWNPQAVPLPLYPSSAVLEEGQPVLLMGFPTGLEAVLAKLDDSEYDEIQNESGLCTYETAERLSKDKKILPSTTGGFLWEVLPKSLVYDARTKEGGSGGPLLNYQGQVIGVNVAYLPGFSGGNYAIPIRFSLELLEGKGSPGKGSTQEDRKLSEWLDQGKIPIASCSE